MAVYKTDAEGRLMYFNSAAARLSGRTLEIGTDKSVKRYMEDFSCRTEHPLPHDQCPMALALKGVEVLHGNRMHRGAAPDGTRFWFTPCPGGDPRLQRGGSSAA